ncbi:MAG: hypothetical protein IPN32_15855 [Deltaproteobacteria bacterium]|nr:hypothetical protein [Deltaproteobacteria bacterium]
MQVEPEVGGEADAGRQRDEGGEQLVVDRDGVDAEIVALVALPLRSTGDEIDGERYVGIDLHALAASLLPEACDELRVGVADVDIDAAEVVSSPHQAARVQTRLELWHARRAVDAQLAVDPTRNTGDAGQARERGDVGLSQLERRSQGLGRQPRDGAIVGIDAQRQVDVELEEARGGAAGLQGGRHPIGVERCVERRARDAVPAVLEPPHEQTSA